MERGRTNGLARLIWRHAKRFRAIIKLSHVAPTVVNDGPGKGVGGRMTRAQTGIRRGNCVTRRKSGLGGQGGNGNVLNAPGPRDLCGGRGGVFHALDSDNRKIPEPVFVKRATLCSEKLGKNSLTRWTNLLCGRKRYGSERAQET